MDIGNPNSDGLNSESSLKILICKSADQTRSEYIFVKDPYNKFSRSHRHRCAILTCVWRVVVCCECWIACGAVQQPSAP